MRLVMDIQFHQLDLQPLMRTMRWGSAGNPQQVVSDSELERLHVQQEPVVLNTW